MDTLYVLSLEDNKWYVGRTGNIERRFEQHMKGEGAKWTFLHKPIKIFETRELKSDAYEDEVTLDYMETYGMRNVRGGQFCSVELKPWDIKKIQPAMNARILRRKTKEFMDMVMNEVTNPDSEMRSGRWFAKMFGV